MEIIADHKIPPLADPTPLDVSIPLDTLERLEKGFKTYGDAFTLPSNQKDLAFYVLTRPEWAEHVLARNHSNYCKGLAINRVRLLLGNGLMASEGALWKRQRQMIQPCFHQRVLNQFETLIQNCNYQLEMQWRTHLAENTEINLTEEMSLLALGFILKAIFSEDLERTIQTTGKNPFDIVADETARDLQFARQFRQLSHLIKEFIEARITKDNYPFDFLSMLMQARHKITDESMPERSIIDETMTLIIAGHETTASALNWTWYLISQHPEVELRLHAEVDKLDGKCPTIQQLDSLPFTKQVIQESMRLYPPGWLLTRKAINDDEIGGYHVPAGTEIFISPYLLHRHPEFWPEPNVFDPDRFEISTHAKRHRYIYIPFSAGARNCIGDHLAMLEMHTHIAYMAQRYRLVCRNTAPIQLEPRVNLRSSHPIMMKIESRNQEEK